MKRTPSYFYLLTSFLFLSFFISPKASSQFYGNLEAYRLMNNVRQGNLAYWYSQKYTKDIKSTLKYVNDYYGGYNILHSIIFWEDLENMDKQAKEQGKKTAKEAYEQFFNFNKEFNIETFLIEEVEFIYSVLGPGKFLWLLTRKNIDGYSPLDVALVSKHFSESDDNWKSKLKPYLSEETINKISGHHRFSSRPKEARGLVYEAFQAVITSKIIGSQNFAPRGLGDCLLIFKQRQIQEVKTALGL